MQTTLMLNAERAVSLLQAEIPHLPLEGKPVELYEPIRYIMSLGGKRMRPVLTLLAYQLFDEAVERAVAPALGIELFHNFTLVHDDIMDKAPLRRGNQTVHEKWNENTAILSGDVMMVKAYQQFLQIDKEILADVLGRFNTTACEVCEGQQLDMNFETRSDVSIPEYLDMIRLKTAVLLGFSLELGARLAGQNETIAKDLYEMGVAAGIGFQLMDDLLDVYGDQSKFGKSVGGDIVANKKTFLLLSALQHAQGKELQELKSWIENKNAKPEEKVKAVRALYDALKVKEMTEAKIEEYFELALKKFALIEAPLMKKRIIKDLLLGLMQRQH
ncbi:MAG: polyprenyl synthetase family protein [Cytophagaceae bacterium]|jgi:geranylgeranyl diphosphate synthase type II|nr:polyprenyl synthetase family protein [Cytophagaceae bacterium]